jgi:hypothetical protein
MVLPVTQRQENRAERHWIRPVQNQKHQSSVGGIALLVGIQIGNQVARMKLDFKGG